MKRCFLGVLLLVCVFIGVWIVAKPSHERNWQEHYDREVFIEKKDEVFVIQNIRDWSYASPEQVTDKTWRTATVSPETLTAVHYLFEPFGRKGAVAHAMLEFSFLDGTSYVVSIEARREEGEDYRPFIAAFLPVHEYVYIWTTARDMYGNTHYYSGDELYRFELQLDARERQIIFEAFAADTQQLAEKPRWYNTIFANCTNQLARVLNQQAGADLPFSLAWIAPGYSIDYLYRLGYLDTSYTIEELYERGNMSVHIEALYDETDATQFAERIHEMFE